MIQILHFSDCHLFENIQGELYGQRTSQTLAAVLRAAAKRASESRMAVVAGDLADDGKEATYRLAERMFAVLGLPVLVIPGNHDQEGPLRRVITGNPLSWKKQIDLGGWNMVFLNSRRPGAVGGELRPEVLATLQTSLATQAQKPALVWLHHPPVPVGTPYMDRIGLDHPQPFFEIIDRHPQIRAILFGHIHQCFDETRRGVRLLSAPSTCVQIAKGSEKLDFTNEPPGFRWLRLFPDGRLETGVERV